MSEKRLDNRKRILRAGEYQLKTGQYRYRYKDIYGDAQDVYSWRLVEKDPIPTGKRRTPSLRELEREIQADLYNQIVPKGGNIDVYHLVEKYVSIKRGVRPSTEEGYKSVLRLLKRDEFGKRRIDKVKTSDAKLWLIGLQENGRGYSTIRTIRGILRPAFKMAVDDDRLRKNPFDFELSTVVYNDSVTREALSREDEKRFLRFISEDSHFSKYYDGIYVLLNTGLRISEFVGLTIKNIDFENKRIIVDHQLKRYNGIGYKIEPPKTEAGNRMVPMTDEVAKAFHRIVNNRPKLKVEPVVDGVVGFLFIDKDGRPMVANHWEKYFQHIVEKHNSIYKVQLPKITPHVCRHTFCSRMAAARMNPKTLSYILGHADISVTLNTYTHVEYDDALDEITKVSEGMKKIARVN